jgi:hypothetical protein
MCRTHDRLPWTTLCAARRRWRPSPICHTPCFRLFQKTRPRVGIELSVASLAVTPMTTRPKDSQSVLVGLLHISLLNLTLSGRRRSRPLPSTPVAPKEKAHPSPRGRRRFRPTKGKGACFYIMYRTHSTSMDNIMCRTHYRLPWTTLCTIVSIVPYLYMPNYLGSLWQWLQKWK